MLEFLSRYRGVIVGAGLALLALGFLTTGGEESGLSGRSFGLLGAPLQALVRGVAHGFGSVVDRYVFVVGAGEEAERLRREVADLRRDLLAVEEVALENARLRELLAFKETTELDLVPARVIGRSASAWFRTLVLDRGAEDGITVDCPILTPAGLAGRIYEVRAKASRALLLTDANSAIDAVVQRTRSQVIVEGQLGSTCRVLYLARGEEAVPGDRVVTAGLGGVFPKGLFLGEITHVESPLGEVFQTAELTPGADLSRLEEVFIVLPGETGGLR